VASGGVELSRLIRTHLTVNAPLEIVWQKLVHLPGYHAWNPFITTASGEVTVGSRLDLTIKPPGGRAVRSRPWVTALQPPRYLEWLGRCAVPGLLDSRHSFALTRMAAGRTLLQQSETFTGLLVPLSGTNLAQTRAGFAAMNAALAEQAERSAHGNAASG
jgi:hypothetical protein